MSTGQLTAVLAAARRGGRRLLLEDEALAIAEAAGIETPLRFVVRNAEQAADLDLEQLPGDRVVVKRLAPGIAHKSEIGGVEVVPRRHGAVVAAIETMGASAAAGGRAGFLIAEWVAHETDPGGELLVGMRWTDDFGPVVTVGPGGVYAERLAKDLDGGRATAILSAIVDRGSALRRSLGRRAAVQMATLAHRGRPPRADLDLLEDLVRRWLRLAGSWLPRELTEFEVNPLVFRRGRPVALDAFGRVGEGEARPAPPRPLVKLSRLLQPRTLALVGVSRRAAAPGRIVLDNLLAAGYERARITIVKAGETEIEGCRCVPDVGGLEARVDLAVVCIGAGEVEPVVARLIGGGKAESLILIAGGLGESPGSEERSAALERLIHDSRATVGGGPVVNGGNCLGVRSVPGGYDTLFIPRHKLSYPSGPPAPLALISQSGAFAVARASRLASLNPRYVISVGNQIDLTVGDYLTHLRRDQPTRVFACYVEGFRPLDGRRWLDAATEIVDGGRCVVLYRGGRSEAGGDAAASHTASVAGDYAVSLELAETAGVLVAETLADFEDLVRLACALDGRRLEGVRMGALSNAGFESVAIADGAGRGGAVELAELDGSTVAGLRGLFGTYQLSSIVAPKNPLDVTPIVDDLGYASAARLLLADPNVDFGLLGCVPLTGSLQTLLRGRHHGEDVAASSSVARHLGRLWNETAKAWAVAVDGGALYDPFAHELERQGIPTFREVDRALRLLGRYVRWRLRYRRSPECSRPASPVASRAALS